MKKIVKLSSMSPYLAICTQILLPYVLPYRIYRLVYLVNTACIQPVLVYCRMLDCFTTQQFMDREGQQREKWTGRVVVVDMFVAHHSVPRWRTRGIIITHERSYAISAITNFFVSPAAGAAGAQLLHRLLSIYSLYMAPYKCMCAYVYMYAV